MPHGSMNLYTMTRSCLIANRVIYNAHPLEHEKTAWRMDVGIVDVMDITETRLQLWKH